MHLWAVELRRLEPTQNLSGRSLKIIAPGMRKENKNYGNLLYKICLKYQLLILKAMKLI